MDLNKGEFRFSEFSNFTGSDLSDPSIVSNIKIDKCYAMDCFDEESADDSDYEDTEINSDGLDDS